MKRLYLISIFILFSISLACSQNEPAIFSVRIPAKNQGDVIIQTGFITSKYKGILTSFHGIYDSRYYQNYIKNFKTPLKINVIHDKTQTLFKDLYLKSVDLDNDLALISSKEIESLIITINTYQLESKKKIRPEEKIIIIGHPAGTSQIERKGFVGNPPLKSRSEFFPPNANRTFHSSKTISEKVLNVEGSFLAGSSGSPILNSRRKIIGMLEGGIFGSTVSWGSLATNWNLSSFDPSDLANIVYDLPHSNSIEISNQKYGDMPIEKDTIEKDTIEKDTIEKDTIEKDTLYMNSIRRNLILVKPLINIDGYSFNVRESRQSNENQVYVDSISQYEWKIEKFKDLDFYYITTTSKIDSIKLFLMISINKDGNYYLTAARYFSSFDRFKMAWRFYSETLKIDHQKITYIWPKQFFKYLNEKMDDWPMWEYSRKQ